MRIMSVVPRTDPSLACWVRMESIASSLEAMGHSIDFFHYGAASHDRWFENTKTTGAHEYVVAPRPVIPFKHLRAISKGTWNLVYANMQTAAVHSCLTRLARVPLVVDLHGDVVAEFWIQTQLKPRSTGGIVGYSKWKAIDMISRCAATRLVCVSRRMMSILEAQGIQKSRMIYVPNGVDLDFFRPSPSSLRENLRGKFGISDALVFGYLGGSARWQGVENFVRASLASKEENLAFLTVGASTDARTRGRLRMLPGVPRLEIPDYYSVCDILVLPRPKHVATEVASPTKFAEYAAMGKPILTTDVGDPAEFVRKYSCGIVVKNDSPEELLEGMSQMASKTESELDAMGKRSRILAEEEFDWKRIGGSLDAALTRLV